MSSLPLLSLLFAIPVMAQVSGSINGTPVVIGGVDPAGAGAAAAAAISGNPIFFSGGIRENSSAYDTNLAEVVPCSKNDIRWAPPAGGATLSIPGDCGQGYILSLTVDPSGNPWTLSTTSGMFNINYANYNGHAFPGTQGAIRGRWIFDGVNFANTVPVPDPATPSVTIGAGLGGTTTSSITTGSNASKGSVVLTSSASGSATAGATIFTYSWSPTLFTAPNVCQFIPQNAPTQAAQLDIVPGVPTTSGVTFTSGGSALPAFAAGASTAFSGGILCQ